MAWLIIYEKDGHRTHQVSDITKEEAATEMRKIVNNGGNIIWAEEGKLMDLLTNTVGSGSL